MLGIVLGILKAQILYRRAFQKNNVRFPNKRQIFYCFEIILILCNNYAGLCINIRSYSGFEFIVSKARVSRKQTLLFS